MTDARLQDGFRAHQAGDLDKAERLYCDVLNADRSNFDALYLLGYIHLQRGQWEPAERRIGEALTINPRSVDALFNRARALTNLGGHMEALSCLDGALSIRPGIPDLLLTRGNVLLALNRAAEALVSYDQVIAVKPAFAEAWNNRGNALAALNRLDEALSSYERMLAARPGDLGALHHRALTLLELKRYEEAAHGFAEVLKAQPAFPYARGNLLYSRLNACDWEGLEHEQAEISARLKAGERVVTPIQHAAFSSSLEDQLQAARIWAADKYPAVAPVWRGEAYRNDRIRVAYLSADFHSHATAALMAGVFEHHDRERFQTVAMSFGPDDGSEMRARLVAAFDSFVDVRDKSDGEVAALLRQGKIDIAVDLKGYTQDSRPGILAHRAGPLQVAYLGFPGTMGVDYIDYIIADRTVIPAGHEPFYSESIAYLPDSYQANDAKRRISETPLARGDFGLPEDAFVFCCFNNNFKIMPAMFAIWMRLLAAVEGSVLWLLEDNPAASRNLRREAAVRGIGPERLVFAQRANLDAHLARHRLADLFLDTLPYNAHTSCSDALWAGLPVITCSGETFAGRVAASLLRAVGLPELVTESLGDYEALAARLARDPTGLAVLKAKLLHNRNTYPLFDTARFTRNLEAAYRVMMERHQQGLPPAHFALSDLEPSADGGAPGLA
jgi:predicted O-linked N-acetylglucosamine transferase (SPINDLY family)